MKERGVKELRTLPDVRARWLRMPDPGMLFRQHQDVVRRLAAEAIPVSAPEGYYSANVVAALPLAPRMTGGEGAIEILLK